jgi:hypothetical protein
MEAAAAVIPTAQLAAWPADKAYEAAKRSPTCRDKAEGNDPRNSSRKTL